ncbi:MAG TPA: UvrB/UvrC motif-containing protein [Gemmatimonadales bacterium]|nr:UvrB/UvrC motif-containing protein [Gemmatimonadales bacterium]
MTCDQCHEREAIVHLTQIVDAEVTTLHLCERCAAERGVEAPAVGKSPLGSFLAAMGKELEGAALPGAATGEACARCGATLRNFRETGRLGCSECWRNFEPQLRELVRRLHGSTFHVGERYSVPGDDAGSERSRLGALREQLRVAIETENFELAAELRDRLRVME